MSKPFYDNIVHVCKANFQWFSELLLFCWRRVSSLSQILACLTSQISGCSVPKLFTVRNNIHIYGYSHLRIVKIHCSKSVPFLTNDVGTISSDRQALFTCSHFPFLPVRRFHGCFNGWPWNVRGCLSSYDSYWDKWTHNITVKHTLCACYTSPSF